MKQRRIILAFSILILVFLIVILGCGTDQTPASSTPVSQPTFSPILTPEITAVAQPITPPSGDIVNPAPTAIVNIQPTQVAESIVQITIKDYKYVPDTVTIKKGTTVIWTNEDSMRHDVVNEKDGDIAQGSVFKSNLLAKGEKFQFTFNKTGQYRYFCTPHPFMKGTIIVQE